ncbi:DUF6434 domain-containing protein [Janthinobacterium sp. SUN128]|uniref:DUF6434 domain-containing protein n=1 Tax=Janthinobacterium TaxID=29580 RepID=UPI00201208AB|nr:MULTISPECIES: DUF6434 domain-containing protein [Janthinobacterium]MDO8033176.1 DUF6434 domain-containing protein [Janthinobacterium sp. SUN128]
MDFNWHGGLITRHTAVDAHYKNTQNVRRFLLDQCGPQFKLDRDFMAWIGDGAAKTMGDVADEWMRRHHPAGDAQINTISTESFT